MARGQKKYNVFIVDDDELSIQIIADMLSEYSEYKVTKFLNSPNALNAIADIKPDIVILDVNMPVMNGFEICEAIKFNHETRRISVILVTTFDSKYSRCDGLVRYGADSYIAKPINRDRLLRCVQNIIKIRERQNPENNNAFFSEAI